ncbi:hypothetical protein L1286_18735 [Pseudoalteromonas sp. SMS1]|uniref:hypothetical protein n=1 Tax=Pseudoalteromonas sp. SMS1 TaxID=2908894 RepID=UPI001F28C16D|nr:hypothetical protein [Pseudoalteromonas sp. SMS1]MCF2859526.1 hypothetical protein [Pseudoalteromonas sp. SMS1]
MTVDLLIMCYLLGMVVIFLITTSYVTIQQHLSAKAGLELTIYWVLILAPIGLMIERTERLLSITVPDYIVAFMQSSFLLLGPLCIVYISVMSLNRVNRTHLFACVLPFVTILTFCIMADSKPTYGIYSLSLIAVCYFQYWIHRYGRAGLIRAQVNESDNNALLDLNLLMALYVVFSATIISLFIHRFFDQIFTQIVSDLCLYVLLISVVLLGRGYVNVVVNRLDSSKNTFNTIK